MHTSPPTHNSVVTKHNTLIPKLAKMKLTELRLLSFCLAHYDSRPDHRMDSLSLEGERVTQEYFRYTATVKDLVDIFPGMDLKSAYEVVKEAVKGVNAKPFEDTILLPNGKTENVLFYWFSGFRYSNDEGRFTFMLSPDIVNLVLSQDGNFTRFRLRHVYQFRSATTWKLYELLKQWVTKGLWSVDLDELKTSLGIVRKYPRWESLKRKVLDESIKEINELSDIIVKYEKKKQVRTVTGIVFFIGAKKDERENDPSIVADIGDTNRDVRLLMGVGINQTNAEYLSRLAAEAGKDLEAIFDRVVARYEAKEGNKPPKQAYIYKALDSEFAPSLFDDVEGETKKVDLGLSLIVSKVGIDAAKQKAISQENNKYLNHALQCTHYKDRQNGVDCPAVRPRTKKCIVCSRLIEVLK